MKVTNTHSLVGVGLLLVAGCVCLYLGEQVTGAALLGVAAGLFGKPPVGLGK